MKTNTLSAIGVIEAAAQSLLEEHDEFGGASLTDEEAAEWLRLIANGDHYLSIHYSDRDGKWYPCLRS